MKCPLILMAWLLKTGEMPQKQADCFKEECVWWSGDLQMCCVRGIARELWEIEKTLQHVMNKMPHEGQFKSREF